MSKRTLKTIATLAVLAALVGPAASAQASAAGALYFTGEQQAAASSDVVCGDYPTYDMVAEAPTDEDSERAHSGPTSSAVGCVFYFLHTADQAFSFGKVVTFHFWLGCEFGASSQPPDTSEFRLSLLHNGATLGDRSIPGASDCLPGDQIEFSLDVPTESADVEPGDEIIASVRIWFSASNEDTKNVFFYVGSVVHPSGLYGEGLPAAGGAANDETRGYVESDFFAADLSFENSTTARYLYHWNTSLAGATDVVIRSNLTNGSASLEVSDGSNVTVLNRTLSGTTDETLVVDDVQSGNWTVKLGFQNATGSFSLGIIEHVVDDSMGNETGNATKTPGERIEDRKDEVDADRAAQAANGTGEGGSSPGPSGLLLVVSLVAIAALARRRPF